MINSIDPSLSVNVSTKAAEFQAEQTDMALANTLDTIAATGGGAGGHSFAAMRPSGSGGSGIVVIRYPI